MSMKFRIWEYEMLLVEWLTHPKSVIMDKKIIATN